MISMSLLLSSCCSMNQQSSYHIAVVILFLLEFEDDVVILLCLNPYLTSESRNTKDSQFSTDSVANVFEKAWLTRYPWPTRMIFDRGSEFKSELCQMIKNDYGVKVKPIDRIQTGLVTFIRGVTMAVHGWIPHWLSVSQQVPTVWNVESCLRMYSNLNEWSVLIGQQKGPVKYYGESADEGHLYMHMWDQKQSWLYRFW